MFARGKGDRTGEFVAELVGLATQGKLLGFAQAKPATDSGASRAFGTSKERAGEHSVA